MKELLENKMFLTFMEILIIIIVILILYFLIKKAFNKLINKATKIKNKKQITMLSFISKICYTIIWFIGILAIMSRFEFFDKLVIPLLSGAGIASVVIGFAAQESLSNFFSSMGIVFSNPFEIGDFIRCVDNDITGEVEEITFRHTIIKTVNNKRVIIPNSKMNNIIIENYNLSDNEICRLVDYSISYSSDVDKAIKIIKNEMKNLYDPSTKKKDIEYPRVRVQELGSSAIILRAWIWGKDNSEAFENEYILNYNVMKQFEKEGIEIPYQYINIIQKKN